MMQQRIDQRAVEIPGGRVHNLAGGLVDDDEMLVLMSDDEVDPLRCRLRRRRFRNDEGEGSLGVHLERGVADRSPARPADMAARMSAFTRSRDSSGTSAAKARSSRAP